MENSSVHNKSKWQIMCILKDKILEVNGTIFGGYVRDSILHDHYAKQYYKVCNNIMANIDRDTSNKQYDNPYFLIESKERLTVPNDIDCYMNESDFPMFMSSLWKDRLSGKLVFSRNASRYISGFPGDTSLKHKRICIEVNFQETINELKKLPLEFDFHTVISNLMAITPEPVFIDVITSSQSYPEPFFTDPDFECNTLYISKHGLSISSRILPSCERTEYNKFLKIKSVIDDILEKKAVYLHPYGTFKNMPKRVSKLISNGWNIIDKFNSIIYIKDSTYEGHCIICHDKLPNTHIKLPCCDARYHSYCLGKTIKSSLNVEKGCIMCKSATDFYFTHTYLFEEEPNKDSQTSVITGEFV
jgi:hypothetical protein